MDIMIVARQLLDSIAAPRGAVTVVPERNGGESWVLKVWVRNGRIPPNVPSTFQGFRVQVEEQPRATAESNRRGLQVFAC